jgi:hypothetical protein
MSACKKPEPKAKTKDTDAFDNIRDKAEIDRLKKILNEKIRDPKGAKKAAYIIAEMLNKTK